MVRGFFVFEYSKYINDYRGKMLQFQCELKPKMESDYEKVAGSLFLKQKSKAGLKYYFKYLSINNNRLFNFMGLAIKSLAPNSLLLCSSPERI